MSLEKITQFFAEFIVGSKIVASYLGHFLMGLVMFKIAACSGLPIPPVSVPFEIATKGATATIHFRVWEEQQYPFYVTHYTNPKIKLPSDYYTKERVEKSVAQATNLRVVKIEKNGEETVLLNEEFSNYKQTSHGSGSTTYEVTHMVLPRGTYTADITSRDDIEIHKAANIRTEFWITQPRSK